MPDIKLLTVLTDLGLSENEAKIYFACLKLGKTSIVKIAQEAGIKRTTVYSVIESLKQKGLVNIEQKGFKKYFVAENPEKLETVLEARKIKLKKSLPQFLGLYNLRGDEALIKYHEGLESVKSVYEGLLKDMKKDDFYLVVSDQKLWQSYDNEYFQNFIEKRAILSKPLRVEIKLLLQESETARHYQKTEDQYNERIKILPKNTKLTTNLIITPRKAVVHQLVSPIMAIVTENKSIINMHKEMFNIIWESVKD